MRSPRSMDPRRSRRPAAEATRDRRQSVSRRRAPSWLVGIHLLGFWAALVSPSAAVDPDQSFHQLLLETWRAEEGLSMGSVVDVVQTSDGYLWLGGYEELVRFDGVAFTVMARANTAGFPGNNLYALVEGAEGGLWIGTDGGGVSHYRDGRFTTLTSAEGLLSDQVAALALGADDSLWIGTFGAGLSRYEDGVFHHYTTQDGLPSGFVTSLAVDLEGRLWVGTKGGLVCLIDGEIQPFSANEQLPDARISTLDVDSQGGLWIGTSGGTLSRFDGGELSVLLVEELEGRDVTFVHRDRDGTVWLATHGGGLFRFHAGRLTVHGMDDGLPSDLFWAMAEDSEGSLWLAAEGGGLSRLRDTRFTTFTTLDGLPHDRIWVIERDAEGLLWLGSDGGGLTRFDEGGAALRTFTTGDGLGSDNVTALSSGADGRLWVGTDRGLFLLQGDRLVPWLIDGLGPSAVILAVYEDSLGDLWVGTEQHGVLRRSGPRTTSYGIAEGLLHNTVRALAEDGDGALWIGTDGGLSRLHDGALSHYPGIDLVRNIYVDTDDTVWVATRGRGLSRLRDGQEITWTMNDGLPTDAMYHLLEDDQRHLWISSNRGIFRLAKDDLEARGPGRLRPLPVAQFGITDGMKTLECTGGSQPAGSRDEAGRLWFPTVQGLVRIDPDSLEPNPLPPPVHIEAVLADGRSMAVHAEDGIVLPPRTQTLDFRYTALSFVDPGRVQFKVRLEGFDRQWVHVGSRRQVQYTNLDPGEYHFRVIASNDSGLWNDLGAGVRLDLRPAFWQTRLFLLFGLFALALMGWAVHRFLVRGQIRRFDALSSMHEALETKNEEIQLRNAEIQSQNALIQRRNAEIESRNAEMERFTYTVSHDLKSPLLTIQGFVGMAQAGLASGRTERLNDDLGRIDSAADKMGHLLDDLLQLSRVGRVANPPREVALDILVRDALERVAGRRHEAGVDVEVAPDLGRVYGDPERLVEVLQNLISNAIKYRSEEAPRIDIATRPDPEGTVVVVRDNGIGIDSEFHDKVFGLFDQLNPKTEGTGIGLALVQRILEVHGGSIWVESEGRGHGSTFAFRLPRVPRADGLEDSGERNTAQGVADSRPKSRDGGFTPV